MVDSPGVAPRRADADAIAALADVLAVHPNEAHWWNHGSFALPLLGGLGCLALGALAGLDEAIGFGAFLLVCALLMLPVVLLGWRSTPTAIVLTAHEALALHEGRALRRIAWADVDRVERFETMGNVRWKLLPRGAEQHLTIDGEIADVPALVARARELAGVAGAAPPAGRRA
jgi:hypothetical protein